MSASCPRCGARFPAGRVGLCPICLLQAELPPATVGSYELIEEIGRGGMAIVYKARDQRLGRAVAVKLRAERLAEQPDSEARRRFEREAQLHARLSHPGIVAVYEVGRAGDEDFMAMELVEGRPLSEHLPLPVDRALDVALQVSDALAYAHRCGVVHRDVKPGNVLLDATGQAKLTDFGIARAVQPDAARLTATGTVLGTPAYLAPEALAGAPPDPRMDVYSLGVVLREMVGGRAPDGGGVDLPPALASVVARATALDPRQRHSSMDELRRDLLRLRGDPEATGLDAEERNWLHAVALVQTLASAAVLWALLVSVTPRVQPAGDAQPLVMRPPVRLADGRVVSRARFETWPTLGALAVVVVAIGAHGLLRRHWRQAGLSRPQPERPVRESRWVLWCGVLAVAVYVVQRSTGGTSLFPFGPILGGLLETAALFLAWVAVLQAWRTSRPLRRELPLWLGLALALALPVIDLTRFLLHWRPD